MDLTLFVIGTFCLSALLGWLTIPHIVLVSKKKRLFDEISDRKSHTGSVPRLGGTSFTPIFLIAFSLMLGFRYYYGYEIAAFTGVPFFTEITFFIAGATTLFFVGLADDLAGLSYKSKLVVQIFSSILFVYAGVGITDMGGLLGFHEISVPVGTLLTIMLSVLIINAYNLIDGIDGLCSGLSLIALFSFGWWFMHNDFYIYAMMAMAMAGVVTVFFYFNINGKKLKVFMGDTGSLALGYLIAFLGLKFYSINISMDIYDAGAPAALFMGVIFVPVFDAVRVFCVRLFNGHSPFYPDKNHIHHKLLRLGMTHKQGMLCIVCIQIFFIIFNILMRNFNISLLFLINISLGIMFNLILSFTARRRNKSIKYEPFEVGELEVEKEVE